MTAGTAVQNHMQFTSSGVPSEATVQVSKQERMLYGEPWAGLVRRLGDAAQALEDARGLADKAFDESSAADGYTNGERDEKGRSVETVRRLSILDRVANAEQRALVAFREIASECATDCKGRREAEPSTSADAVRAPEMVVAN